MLDPSNWADDIMAGYIQNGSAKLLAKTLVWLGPKVISGDRWIRRNFMDLKFAYVWGTCTVVAVLHYPSTEATPLVVQMALVVPLMEFATMVAADRLRRFRLKRESH